MKGKLWWVENESNNCMNVWCNVKNNVTWCWHV